MIDRLTGNKTGGNHESCTAISVRDPGWKDIKEKRRKEVSPEEKKRKRRHKPEYTGVDRNKKVKRAKRDVMNKSPKVSKEKRLLWPFFMSGAFHRVWTHRLTHRPRQPVLTVSIICF